MPQPGVQVIALGQHVDYWDRLGWKDRFSSATVTARQQVYGARFNNNSIYTPQMVVDRAGTESQAGGDLAVGGALGGHPGDLQLLGRQPGGGRLAHTMRG